MVLPAMVYVPTPAELEHHFRAVAAATGLPIMLYNNPPSYRVNIDIATLARLADVPNIVAIKESAPDSRRITDIINAFGERFVLFAGLDDMAFEGLTLGAKGWVSGLTNAFPAESLRFYAALRAGRPRHARGESIAGSCRCCTWTRSTIWCNRSSSPNRSWAAARSGCARRGCRLPASAAPRSSPWSKARARLAALSCAPSIRVIDSHTGGEPTRLVLEGGPDLGDGPLAERVQRFREHFDAYRSAIVNEPRGSDPLVGALLVKPHRADCAFGVIFFNNVGYLGMCGHGTIGLIASLSTSRQARPRRRQDRYAGGRRRGGSCTRTAASAWPTW